MGETGPTNDLLTSATRQTVVNGGARPAGASGCIQLPTPCRHPAPCGLPCELKLGPERHAVVELGNLARLAIMAVPGSRGSFAEQGRELLAQVCCIVRRQSTPLRPTTMMVFLRDGMDEPAARELVNSVFGDEAPVTTFVVQPPVCGAALGIELWAMGGKAVRIERPGPEVLTADSNGIRWVYCGGFRGEAESGSAYREAMTAFQRMTKQLTLAGVNFAQVVRTWIYINQITGGPEGRQRYQELNRARTDFYSGVRFGATLRGPLSSPIVYPASTGIGTGGNAMGLACVALDSRRPDVFIVPLENPRQTPACGYQAAYSPKSPKFARAMAVVQGDCMTTLVSGTASIVGDRTVHSGDVVRQTEETLENIKSVLARENFARHGLSGAGATWDDVAKLRVYLKRASDYECCREVVERCLPKVPAIYLQADICRPDLLVEIEAVAFSAISRGTECRLAD